MKRYTKKELEFCLDMPCVVQNKHNKASMTIHVVSSIDIEGLSLFEVIEIPSYDKIRGKKLTKLLLGEHGTTEK